MAVAAVFCTAVAAAALFPAEEDASEVMASAPDAPVYTLRACEGGVAVYRGGDELLVAPIDVTALRHIDRDMFSRGVSVETWEEALHLIEDFSP